MKLGKIILNGTMLLIIAASGLYIYDAALFKSLVKSVSDINRTVPGTYMGNNLRGVDWADAEDVQTKVEADVLKNLRSTDRAAVKAFVKNPQNRLMLAQWMLAQSEVGSAEMLKQTEDNVAKQIEKLKGEIAEIEKDNPAGVAENTRLGVQLKSKKKTLSEWEAEAMQSHAMLESISQPGAGKLMEQISNNLDWLEQFVWTGECERPGVALAILAKIVEKNPDIIYNQTERDIATAVAIEFAKSGWQHNAALERAEFYLKHWRDGRLNKVFDTLPFWQRRMVVGCKGDNPWGTVESMQWSLDNVHLPAEQYPGCCWRCGYKLYNLYGESIHGPGYMKPFEDNYGTNRAKFTYEVGGVCGSLSHFGAFGALANGIPALTAGEPGHCAYIVLVGDKWTPAYSLSWERGLHWQVWKNVYKFSSLHMATKCYSKEEAENTQLSNAYRTLGAMYAKSDVKKATECFDEAVKAQPLNFPAWRAYAQFLADKAPKDAEAWKKLNRDACAALVAEWPEMAAQLMQLHIYPGMQKAMDGAALRQEFLTFWDKVSEMGPDRWPIEALCDEQVKLQGKAAAGTEGTCKYYADVLKRTVSNNKYAPAILNWGNNLGKKLNQEGNARLMQATIEGIASGSGDMNTEDRIKLFAPAILAAEKNRDLSAFQALGKMVQATGHKNPGLKMPAIPTFPGKLASEGGMVWMSSTSQWDKPHEHAGLLTPEGGTFHTAKDKDAYVAVELPRQVNVTGIVIVASPGNMHRLNNMKIQVSETGKDDDWHDVSQLGPCKQRVMQVDLGSSKPLAKYVRIVRPGGPEFFHLNGIYIYGEQAA